MRKIIYIAALFIIACQSNDKTNNEEKNGKVFDKSFLQSIEIVKSYNSPLQKELILTGKVNVDPDKTVSYSPLVNGVIVKTYFSHGDKVKKNQQMADIRSTELSSLQSELLIAKRNMQSIESKFNDGLANEIELVEAKSNYEKLKSDISLFGESLGNGIFSVKSPGNGYVTVKNGNAGSPISQNGDPIFSISDLSCVWIEANLYAGNLRFVKEKQEVEISTVAYPNEIFKGEINFISQVFDSEDKSLKVRIVMDNNELKLKPEMSEIGRASCSERVVQYW